MLQLEEKHRIVQACRPKDEEEALKMWHEIKPVKFGDIITWAAGEAELASYQVPQDAGYLLITRVEAYAFTTNSAIAGYGLHMPIPTGSAQWISSEVSGITPGEIKWTPFIPAFLLVDSEEFLFIAGDNRAVLRMTLPVAPTIDLFIRTLVYGYLLGAITAGKIGDSESTYYSNT